MENIPTVSVIVPTYNRSSLVVRAVQSVLDQTFGDFEILVVDDGSTDNTREVLSSSSDKRIRYVSQSNLGPAAARNKGYALSHGKYVHFLDSDDYFLPTNLAEKANILNDSCEIGWVFSDCYYRNDNRRTLWSTNGNIRKLRKSLIRRSFVFDLLLMCYFVNIDTVMIRRECIERIGGFDENLESFEDMDFYYRIASMYKTKFIDAPLVVISHQEEDSLSRDRDRFFTGRIQVIEKTKQLFPFQTQEIRFPGRRAEADILNYLGTRLLEAEQEKMAIQKFLKSIRVLPFQKKVYRLLALAMFNALGRR